MDTSIELLASVAHQTITVGSADSGRVLALRVGDRLAIDAPVVAGASWRLRGGGPLLTASTPGINEPAFVLVATRPGRTGVDLVATGTNPIQARPIRLIVTIS